MGYQHHAKLPEIAVSCPQPGPPNTISKTSDAVPYSIRTTGPNNSSLCYAKYDPVKFARLFHLRWHCENHGSRPAHRSNNVPGLCPWSTTLYNNCLTRISQTLSRHQRWNYSVIYNIAQAAWACHKRHSQALGQNHLIKGWRQCWCF